MTEFVIPPSLCANEVDWTLVDYTGAQISPLSGAVRTISRGQRWQAHLTWSNLVDEDRALFAAFMARVCGKSNRVWLADPGYQQRGSFPTQELLVNPLFDGTTGWAPYTGATLKGNNREMQVQAPGTSSYGFLQAVNLNAAMAYCLRSIIVDGALSSAVTNRNQWSQGATSFVSPTSNLRGMYRNAGVSNAFTAWNVFPLLMTTGTPVAGSLQLCNYASMARCAMVVNPSAAIIYNSVKIDALPFSTDGLLRAGDHVEINGEFKTVTSDLNSDGIGSGWLMFEPAMRTQVVPDNSPVVIFQPMMRGYLASDAMQPSRPGPTLFSDFEFTFVEA